jgi:CubicO group peptidase (beta-lactamase class C family)
MVPSLSSTTTTTLRDYIDNATKSTSSAPLPGAFLHIVDAQNNVLFSHGTSSSITPTSDSLVYLQSLTKLIGAIAFLQLVDRGLTSLDDPTVITTHLPELAAQNVLTGYSTDASGKKIWTFEDRVGVITPRMLLNHTYGGGHTYFNKLLLEYFQDKGIWATTNEATDTYNTVLNSPLLWQPNTQANYGQGLDWIAVLLERLTKQSCADYLQAHIFSPLGLKSIGFEPAFGGDILARPESSGRFWPRVLKAPDGFMTLDPPSGSEKITHENPFPAGSHHTGGLGSGLVSSAADYVRIVSVLLPENVGVDAETQHRLLTPSSVKEITTACLPAHLQHQRQVPDSGGTPIIVPVALDAPHLDPKGSYGLACGVQGADRVLKNGKRGRSKGSVYWYGAANTDMWVDGEKGIVVFANGNYYPWNEEGWVDFVAKVEGMVYEGLE